jgi:hypothetical protein
MTVSNGSILFFSSLVDCCFIFAGYFPGLRERIQLQITRTSFAVFAKLKHKHPSHLSSNISEKRDCSFKFQYIFFNLLWTIVENTYPSQLSSNRKRDSFFLSFPLYFQQCNFNPLSFLFVEIINSNTKLKNTRPFLLSSSIQHLKKPALLVVLAENKI